MNFDPPPVVDWVFTNTHHYTPTEVQASSRERLVLDLLTADKKFSALLNQCTTDWVIAVALGKSTLHLTLWERSDIQGVRPTNTPLPGHENDVMLQVDHYGALEPLSRYGRNQVLLARPFTRGARTLTAVEKALVHCIVDIPAGLLCP